MYLSTLADMTHWRCNGQIRTVLVMSCRSNKEHQLIANHTDPLIVSSLVAGANIGACFRQVHGDQQWMVVDGFRRALQITTKANHFVGACSGYAPGTSR